MTYLRIVIPLYLVVLSIDLFGKPVPTFPDHALKTDRSRPFRTFPERLRRQNDAPAISLVISAFGYFFFIS
jgi:hypothetical protein